jgi:hypothetical protein
LTIQLATIHRDNTGSDSIRKHTLSASPAGIAVYTQTPVGEFTSSMVIRISN